MIDVIYDMTLDEEEKEFEMKKLQVEVSDMAWDQGEDHLMVSYANGQMGMVDFGGFEEGKTEWKSIY